MKKPDAVRLGHDDGIAEVTFTQTYDTTATTVPNMTGGVGTGADGTTPSGAEHTLLVNDVTENRKLLGAIIDILQDAGYAL